METDNTRSAWVNWTNTNLTLSVSLTGPVSPQSVTVDSVGSDHVNLSWNVSAFMQMTPHSYNVTTCTNTCGMLLYPYLNGSTFVNISISNLTSATEYFIQIAAFVVRPDNSTGEKIILQSNPATLQVKTGRIDINVLFWILCLSQSVYICCRFATLW